MSDKPVMEPTPKNIGKRIREARESAELSQTDLSKKTDLSVSQISRYENGKSKGLISLRNLAKIAFAVNVSIDELYFGKREFRFLYTARNEGELIVNCLYALYKHDIICSFDKMHKECPRQYEDDLVPFYCVYACNDCMSDIEKCFVEIRKIEYHNEINETKKDPELIKQEIFDCFRKLARKII